MQTPETRNDIRIGPAGWSYRDWNGVVYPTNRPAGFHEAEYLAGYFDLIEINTSFYRPLPSQLAQVWTRKLSGRPNLQFTAKLYRGFTHEGRFDRGAVRQVCEGLEPLIDDGRLGCLLMQFPWSFRRSAESLAYLGRLAKAFEQYPLVAEFRHSSWNHSEALHLLSDLGVGFCNIDQPQLNQCLQPTEHVTAPVAYVRLHGRNYEEWFRHDDMREDGLRSVDARYNYLYAGDEIQKWSARIERLAARAETVYVVTNNHFRGQAVVNALEILANVTGRVVETPPTLLEHYPELNRVAANLPPQRSLFFEQRRAARSKPVHRATPRRFGVSAVYARA